MLAYRKANGKDSDIFKHISPVAWQNVNLYGRYEFNTNSDPINMDAIILELAKFLIVPNEWFAYSTFCWIGKSTLFHAWLSKPFT